MYLIHINNTRSLFIILSSPFLTSSGSAKHKFFTSHWHSLQVTSPYGNNLHHVENVTHGQFAFTTTESGSYLACFWLDGEHQEGVGATLNLDWRSGIAARDWDSVAKKQKVEVTYLEAVFAGFLNDIFRCL